MRESYIKNQPFKSKTTSFVEQNLELKHVSSNHGKSHVYKDEEGESFHRVSEQRMKGKNSYKERMVAMLTKGIINTSDTIFNESTNAFYQHEQSVASVETQKRLEFDSEIESDLFIFQYIFNEGHGEKIYKKNNFLKRRLAQLKEDKWKAENLFKQVNIVSNKRETKKYYFDFSDTMSSNINNINGSANVKRFSNDLEERLNFILNSGAFKKEEKRKIIEIINRKTTELLDLHLNSLDFFYEMHEKAKKGYSGREIKDPEDLFKELKTRAILVKDISAKFLNKVTK